MTDGLRGQAQVERALETTRRSPPGKQAYTKVYAWLPVTQPLPESTSRPT